MACTTILVGKKASYNGSTLVARNDDSPSGSFHVKKMVVVDPSKQPRHYEAKGSAFVIELPDNPMRYTMMPNVDPTEGVWPAAGFNAANVGMSATETITSNPRVLGADPYVNNGLGEEELVLLVLPYIHSAKEGVIRLGKLLEQYGTYEPNGIAFSDHDEIWWLETIGGHHWIARRVPDDAYVMMPNQFGLDHFDFDDAYVNQKEYMCSSDLKEFMRKYHLDLNQTGEDFNPRLAFGSHDDSDHVYNTPRAWYMARYFNPRTFSFDGIDANFSPEDDDLPWCLVPERKITVEEVKYILSSHYQGTPYDPYSKLNDPRKGLYRPIGISRTSFLGCLEIRNDVPSELACVEWVAFGSNVFNAFVPLYANVKKIPAYFSNTTMNVNTNNFYWASRLLGVLADPHFNSSAIHIERYQNSVMNKARAILNKYDDLKDPALLEEANQALADMAEKETQKVLNNLVYVASMAMKNGFSRSDN